MTRTGFCYAVDLLRATHPTPLYWPYIYVLSRQVVFGERLYRVEMWDLLGQDFVVLQDRCSLMAVVC